VRRLTKRCLVTSKKWLNLVKSVAHKGQGSLGSFPSSILAISKTFKTTFPAWQIMKTTTIVRKSAAVESSLR